MISSEPFNPYDSGLVAERYYCKERLFQFNLGPHSCPWITPAERQRIFRAAVEAKRTNRQHPEPGVEPFLHGHVGKNTYVDMPFYCDYGYQLVIGDMVTIGPNCIFMDSGKITIGNRTRICANVIVDTQRFLAESKSDKAGEACVVAADVTIGENCYIGPNVTLMGPLRIDSGAIIHPGSVVTKVCYIRHLSSCAF